MVAAAELETEVTKGVKAFAELNYGKTSVDSKFEGHPFQSPAMPAALRIGSQAMGRSAIDDTVASISGSRRPGTCATSAVPT